MIEYTAFTAMDEKARVVELNSKLHELCRELRKENALLLDTSKAISAQELSQRKALTENFQETVEGITRRYASSFHVLFCTNALHDSLTVKYSRLWWHSIKRCHYSFPDSNASTQWVLENSIRVACASYASASYSNNS